MKAESLSYVCKSFRQSNICHSNFDCLQIQNLFGKLWAMTYNIYGIITNIHTYWYIFVKKKNYDVGEINTIFQLHTVSLMFSLCISVYSSCIIKVIYVLTLFTP